MTHEVELIFSSSPPSAALEKGTRITRHKKTASSAENVICLILDNHPPSLRIQTELVNEDITETGAGELNRELNSQITKVENKDEETRRELEIETKRMQSEIARFENDAKKLTTNYVSEKGKFDTRLAGMEVEARRKNRSHHCPVSARYRRIQQFPPNQPCRFGEGENADVRPNEQTLQEESSHSPRSA